MTEWPGTKAPPKRLTRKICVFMRSAEGISMRLAGASLCKLQKTQGFSRTLSFPQPFVV
jgi:hypothetical protein